MSARCSASGVAAWRRGTGAAFVAALLAGSSAAAFAQGSVFLQTLARVNVITSNCPGWEISHGEWVLLTGTGDALAARLGLDPALYERRYFGRAFELLDDPANCDRIGPEARPLLRRLVAMGGSTDAIVSGIPAVPGKPAAAGANPPGKAKGASKGKGQGKNNGQGNSKGSKGHGNNKGQGSGKGHGNNKGQGSGKGNSNGKGQGNSGPDKSNGRSGKP